MELVYDILLLVGFFLSLISYGLMAVAAYQLEEKRKIVIPIVVFCALLIIVLGISIGMHFAAEMIDSGLYTIDSGKLIRVR